MKRVICFSTRLKACKCILDASVFNNRQRWNTDKCKCECRELIDNGSCVNRFI